VLISRHSMAISLACAGARAGVAGGDNKGYTALFLPHWPARYAVILPRSYSAARGGQVGRVDEVHPVPRVKK